MLLEYVSGGNFTDFMANTDPPEGPEETMKFWRSLSEVVKPILRIHSLPNLGEGHPSFQGYVRLDHIQVSR